jgi:two-component system OmpR family sensor kinase
MPSGEMIEVGCYIGSEIKDLRFIAIMLTVVGGIILMFGLVGGWWLVSRSLKPVSEISAAAVKISSGDLSQRITVAEAESELGQLAAVLNSTFARLETAFAQQKQFTADAAHELRTPVSVMLTQTQTALNRERDSASYKQTVEACQRAAQRMRKLIESLLALARFDAGQEVLNRLRFDFSRTIADSADLIRPLADERGVKLLVEAGTLEVTGDSERLAQVVTNLLTNAVPYNKPDGEVRVRLESQNGLAVLTVSDTGLGIDAEDLPHVYERFFRADPSRTCAGNAGLGLAISKAIVEAHGGTIEVSGIKNAGAVFTVRLPV